MGPVDGVNGGDGVERRAVMDGVTVVFVIVAGLALLGAVGWALAAWSFDRGWAAGYALSRELEHQAGRRDAGEELSGQWGEPVAFDQDSVVTASELNELGRVRTVEPAVSYVEPAVTFGGDDGADGGGFGEVPDLRALDSDEVRAAIGEVLRRRRVEQGEHHEGGL